MKFFIVCVFLCGFLNIALCIDKSASFRFANFPANFQWGIKDSCEHLPSDVKVPLLKELGVNVYKFSLDWNLDSQGGLTIDPATLTGYQDSVIELENIGIKSHVVLFDTKDKDVIDKLTSMDSVTELCNSATYVFQNLTEKVALWSSFAFNGIQTSFAASSNEELINTAYFILQAHSCIYNSLKNIHQKGQLGIDIQGSWFVAQSHSLSKTDPSTEKALALDVDLFLQPLIGRDIAKEYFGLNVPHFSPEQIINVNNSLDFVTLTYRGTFEVNEDTELQSLYSSEVDSDKNGGLQKLLKHVGRSLSKTVQIYVSDVGIQTNNVIVKDKERVNWMRSNIQQVLKSIQIDRNSNIGGYVIPSFVDTEHCPELTGIFSNTPDQNFPVRKASAVLYKQIIHDNGFERGFNGIGGFPSGEISHEDGIYYDDFPDNFGWSSATSAYQIEGGWNADGKGLSIWDTRSHTPNIIHNNETGDVACDSYNKYKDDVKLLKDLGVKFYRFSIAWTRLMPDGTTDYINQRGINYYNNLIDALLADGITPMITLFHWDLPQNLMDNGGWLNETIKDRFKDYAKLCFEKFGDRVNYWITFNEPKIITVSGYDDGWFPPGHHSHGQEGYIAAHNLIKAHAEAYHVFKQTQNGKIGITISVGWPEPVHMYDPEDLEASERDTQFSCGWFAHPIFVDGDYSPIMKKLVSEKSYQQGFNVSRLPEFTDEEKTFINGTFDFFGLNFYSAGLVTSDYGTSEVPSYYNDKDTKGVDNPNYLGSGSSWLHVTPFGMRKILNWVKRTYNNVPVYVTESGVSDRNGTLMDYHRIHYYRTYINELLKAIKLDGCNVKGFTAWSLMDNFEWNTGYSERFGIHYINFTDPDRKRTPKGSAYWYRQLISENAFTKGYPGIGGRGTAPDYVGKTLKGIFPPDFVWGMEGLRSDTLEVSDLIQALVKMKVGFYKFKIPWNGILPRAGSIEDTNEVNKYTQLIKQLRQNNIAPWISLDYFDVPKHLQDAGSWSNNSTVIEFENYARVCFSTFGDIVETWLSLDNANLYLRQFDSLDQFAIMSNLLLAHNSAFHIFKTEFRRQYGTFGLALLGEWHEPQNEFSTSDWEASETAMKNGIGRIAEPIFGNSPKKNELPDVRVSADMVFVDISKLKWCTQDPSTAVTCISDTDFRRDPSYRQEGTQWAVRKTLNWIKRSYGNIPVYVTSTNFTNNVLSSNQSELTTLIQENVNEVLKAAILDDVRVAGYLFPIIRPTESTLSAEARILGDIITQYGSESAAIDQPACSATTPVYPTTDTEHKHKTNASSMPQSTVYTLMSTLFWLMMIKS
ncbi:lactase/phlorizin hydrolase-like [Mya arenaria]|nr:lactase/phlorizin hydrolase-like [Mya arenaria]